MKLYNRKESDNPLQNESLPKHEPVLNKSILRTNAAFEAVHLALYQDLFTVGEARAVESGTLKPVPTDLESLIRHARAMAQDAKRESFDPANNQADLLRNAEFEKLLEDRLELETTVKHAIAHLHEAEAKTATWQLGELPVAPSQALQWSATIVIAVSVAVTLHDQVFTFADEVLSWVCSFVIGILCGWFITTFILYHTGSANSIALSRRVGLIAGVAIGLGLFALRIAQNSTIGSFVFALGMTLLELGAVFGLDSVATRFRVELCQFRERELEWKQVMAARDVAEKKMKADQQALQIVEAEIQAHIDYVNERQLRHQHVGELEALAVDGVQDGYASGVAKNIGKVRTVRLSKGGAQ